MANEVTVYADLAYADANGVQDEVLIDGVQFSVATKVSYRGQQSIATTETAIGLGGVAAVGWLMIKNLDAANPIDIKTAASGVIFARVPAGGVCLLYLGSGVTAPVAIATGGAVLIDKLICSQ